MPKLVPGVNDLATLFPDLAADADGWDPKTITPGRNKKNALEVPCPDLEKRTALPNA